MAKAKNKTNKKKPATTSSGARIGRPPKDDKDKVRTPARQLGRVKEDDWNKIQAGFALSGFDFFTPYAVEVLLKNTKRLQRKASQ